MGFILPLSLPLLLLFSSPLFLLFPCPPFPPFPLSPFPLFLSPFLPFLFPFQLSFPLFSLYITDTEEMIWCFETFDYFPPRLFFYPLSPHLSSTLDNLGQNLAYFLRRCVEDHHYRNAFILSSFSHLYNLKKIFIVIKARKWVFFIYFLY